jgi:hypothetical protein
MYGDTTNARHHVVWHVFTNGSEEPAVFISSETLEHEAAGCSETLVTSPSRQNDTEPRNYTAV